MRNLTLNEELCFSSDDTLVFFYSTEYMNRECNHSKASKGEEESNTKNKPTNKISQGRVPSPNKQFFTSLHIGIREYV